jgi:hypothetical protein
VDSRLDTLIHKASIAIQTQMSVRRSSWSERACIRNENYVHQINRPDDHPPGPDSRSLIWKFLAAEVQLSGRQGTTVQTRLKNRKEFQRNSQEINRTVVRLDGA